MIYVAPAGLASDEALREWVGQAVAFRFVVARQELNFRETRGRY